MSVENVPSVMPSTRDERMKKRNSTHENIEVNSGNKKAIKANKSSTNPAPLEFSDNAEAEIIIPSMIIQNGNPDRQVIILPYENDDGALWKKPNIAYFRSSGTSNKGCGWLCGTFFPTGGITTKIRDGKKTVGINDTCDETEGHLLKMSDITNGATILGIVRSIDSFYTTLANVLLPFFKNKPANRNLPAPTILNLFDAFNTYFLTEYQILLSYRLSFTGGSEHIGLWGWKYDTFKLSDFCNNRWENPTPITIPTRNIILNNTGACEFIKEHNANVNFEEMQRIFFVDNGGSYRSNALGDILKIDRNYYKPEAVGGRNIKRNRTMQKHKCKNKKIKRSLKHRKS